MVLQALLDGLMYAAIGIGIVFTVLVVIMYCIKLVSAIVVAIEKKMDAAPKKPVKEVKSAVPAQQQATTFEGVSPEVVAAITAAVNIIMSEPTTPAVAATPLSFKVRKIKRI